MKKQSLILLALLMVISCSKPNVQKEMKIVEQEAAPVVEEPIIVEKKAEPVVEKPKIISCSFDKKYLEIPKEIYVLWVWKKV